MTGGFTALARGITGFQRNRQLAEQDDREEQRLMEQIAHRKWLDSENMKRQTALDAERQEDRALDRRTRDEQAMSDMVSKGFEQAGDEQVLNAGQLAMSMATGGTGAGRAPIRQRDATPFQAKVGEVDFQAPTRKAQYVTRNGQLYRLDTQEQANEATAGQARTAAIAAQARREQEAAATREREEAGKQREREIRLQASLRPETRDQNAPKRVPLPVAKAYQENTKQLRTLDDAIAGVESNPKAVGLKAYLPDVILNRLGDESGAYQGGVDARAGVADIGSLVIHDRSGAAVSASEFPRLKPFIPLPTDDHATVLKKLRRMRSILAEETQSMAEFYNEDQGYLGLPGTPSGAAGAAAGESDADMWERLVGEGMTKQQATAAVRSRKR